MPRQVPSGPVALPPIPFRAKATIPNPGKPGLPAPVTRLPEGIPDIHDPENLCPPMAAGDHYIYLGDRG
ncbi:hypothetical protein MBBA_2360 [Methanoculleus bourgensis]|jgi:hypothetical protein|nr:hypothetical protein MBBA_2360 [Methanoculleus bourgensis]